MTTKPDTTKEPKKPDRPMPNDSEMLARAMFQYGDRRIEGSEQQV